jgi:hypothetical protein
MTSLNIGGQPETNPLKNDKLVNRLLSRIKPTNKMFGLVVILLCLGYLIYYIYQQINLKTINCHNIKKVYGNDINRHISSIYNSGKKLYNIRDYYIKTAYNCCSTGQFKNDYVSECALKEVIKQGVRCLDFEIYSIDNKPVIATSSIDDYTIKETYNSLSCDDVFKDINKWAFNHQTCPNPEDPLFINLRIKSNNCKIYGTDINDLSSSSLLSIIHKNFSDRLLDAEYSYEYQAMNLGNVPLNDIKKKIIIMIDGTNPLFRHTGLNEYVNIAGGTTFFRHLKNKDVIFTQDLGLTDHNKKKMSIVLPDISPYDTNPNFNIVKQYGCQFIGMSFQNFDSHLEYYNEFFDSEGSAFVLKPDDLRYIPVTIPEPPPQNPEYSYKTRPIKSDFYSYKI